MPKLIMLRGLPGSGKSTWARSYLADNEPSTVRVNKDDLRAMLHGDNSWSNDQERITTGMQNLIIFGALERGLDVIVDNTHVTPYWEQELRSVANRAGADFVIKDFLNVPLTECIRRDSERTGKARVGKEVIERLHQTAYNHGLVN